MYFLGVKTRCPYFNPMSATKISLPEKIDSLFDLPYTGLKRIEGGTFLFQNKQEVFFDRDFYAGVYLVTQELYERVIGINPSHFEGKCRPVETVSWNDAQVFLEKLNDQTQGQYDDDMTFQLPTEALWEYCARNHLWEVEGKVSTQRHKWGDFSGSHVLDEVGWYDDNSGRQMQPVGLKEPNLRGLHDMSGNVWEWCEDYYAEEIPEAYKDGLNMPEVTKKISRVVRGGSWYDYDHYCRLLDRNRDIPGDQSNILGFRLFRY